MPRCRSGAARQAASKARQAAGMRMIWVEIHDTEVPEALIRAGLLSQVDETNWRKIGEVISGLVAIWADTLEQPPR